MKSNAIFIYLILGTIFSAGCQNNKPKSEMQAVKNKFLDIAYANQSPAQKMDIYLPESIPQLLPVIINVHGGAFLMGDKTDGMNLNPMALALKRGYAFVAINYRLSGEAIFPAQINDVKAAIRFIRANAAKYNFNPNKIAVWGRVDWF